MSQGPQAGIFKATCLVALAAAVAMAGSRLDSRSRIPPACGEHGFDGVMSAPPDAAAHRLFELPVIHYPHGTELPDEWGLQVTVMVDERRRVACYELRHPFEADVKPTAARSADGTGHAVY